MAWPYTFAALQSAKGSYLDSNFADAAQLGTDVTFSGIDGTPIGATTPAAGSFTTLAADTITAAGEISAEFINNLTAASTHAALTVTSAGYLSVNVLDTNPGSGAPQIALSRQSTSGSFIEFLYGAGSLVGSIATNGTSTSYNTTSDAALKALHGPADGTPLSVLPVRDAAFTAAPTARRPMLIAQEVAAVCPWAVTEGDGTPAHPSMIDHGALVPAVLAYVQSIDARLAAIESAVTALRASLPATVGPSLSTVIGALAPAATSAAVSAKAALADVLALPVMQAAIARGNAAATGGTSGQTVIQTTP